MTEELKQEVERIMENNKEKNDEPEQEYIQKEQPKDFWLPTTEVEQLKIENLGLKRAMLAQQQKELEIQMSVFFDKMKARAKIPKEAHIKVHPQDITKVMVSFEGGGK
jgi:hypothetical protein